MGRPRQRDRRAILKLAAGGSLATLAGCTTLQLTGDEPSGTDPTSAFELGASTNGWRGIAPEQIRGETNPILRLTPRTTVTLTWENLDGHRHQFVIEDSLGETLIESAPSSHRGATRTVTFDAKQEMTTYLDPGDDVIMRGEILVSRH